MQRDPIYITLIQSPAGTTGISFHLIINSDVIENGFISFIGVEITNIIRFVNAFNLGHYQTLTPDFSPFHFTVENSINGNKISINTRGELSLLLSQKASIMLIKKLKRLVDDIVKS